MKKIIAVIVFILCSGCGGKKFMINSPEIEHKGRIQSAQVFSGFGCTGKNQSPSLIWKNPPEGTKSFALFVYDPDAPTGSGWWHWIVYNLPVKVRLLPTDAGREDGSLLPLGAVHGKTDFNTLGYGGPCPPAGGKPHRYIFTLYALKIEKLPLQPYATAAMIGFVVNQNAIAKTSFLGYYSR
jgi:hypothetical protein